MDQILVGKGEQPVYLLAKYGNRHGLVAGATGTGKTVSLHGGGGRLLAARRAGVHGRREGRRGRPGHGRRRAARRSSSARPRSASTGYAPEASPVVFWDLYGKAGHPVRTTISEMGPSLLGRILELNDTQAGVLEIAFKLADDRGLLLLDLDDLRALLGFVADNRKEISTQLRPGERLVAGRHPARPADARARGRPRAVRRAGARSGRSDAHRPRAGAASSTSSPPTS